MKKVPKVKKREVSLHSRAARRGATPPPKDLTVKKASAEETDYKPWLHTAQSAGISKKKKTKQLTRQQKVRQQKAFEKADMNVNKLERKVAESKARAKKVQGRAKDWDELNQSAAVKKSESAAVPGAEGGSDEQKMEGVVALDPEQPLPTRTGEMEASSAAEPPAPVEAEEEFEEVT